MADQYAPLADDLAESAGQVQPDQNPAVPPGETKTVEEVRENLGFVLSYEDAQRKAEDEELYFEGVDMWDEDARTARESSEDDLGHKIPGKPIVSVNLLDQNIQQVVSEGRSARLSLTVKPKAGIANTATSNHMKGLVRSIQVESGALEVRLWALERAAKVGRGGYLLETEFADESDFDLELRLGRILDYSTVYWDPYSQKADRSDAEWCIVTDWISERERKRRWPTKPIMAPQGAFSDTKDEWFAAADEGKGLNRRIRIATYYKVETVKHTLGFHPDFGRGWIGEKPSRDRGVTETMPDDLAKACLAEAEGTRTKEVEDRSVMIYTVDGVQVLEKHPWHGRYIPILEVIGKEYFVKGKRRWKGMIANAAEILRVINVLVSAAVELAGSMPRIPYMMAVGQDQGVESMWDDAGVKNYTRLLYVPQTVDGVLVGAPTRQNTEPQIQGLMLLIRMMHEMYHAVTGSVAPQLRAVNPYDRSGKAIEALQRQGAAGTSNYLDNLATITMLHEGKVLVDAIPHYYDREGRVVRVMGEEHEDEAAVMIKVPFYLDADGAPQPVPCPACQGAGVTMQRANRWNPLSLPAPVPCAECHGSKVATKANAPKVWQEKPVEYVDFSEGAFKVQAALDRSYQTKQDEALAGMETLAKSAPGMVPMFADLWVRAMAFSGSNEIADRIKARMPEGSDDLKEIPPEFQGRFVQMQTQYKQAVQALQEAQQLLQTDAMKQAGQKEIALIKGALEEKLVRLKSHGKILEQKAQTDDDGHLEILRSKLEQMQVDVEHRHEVLLEQMTERHDVIMQLLKEQSTKEIERHGAGLHDAAATKAAQQADLHAERADTRKEAAAVNASARTETAADRAAAREVESGDSET